MNFPIELYVGGRKGTASLDDLSSTGMFVRTNPVPLGTIVHVAMTPIPGRPRVVTAGTVVHSIDESEAHRLGRTAGIGVQFRDPINTRDAQFAEVVGEMVARHIHLVPAPTQRIVVGDHHLRVVEQLSDQLGRAGFSVAVGTTGVEVLSACHRHQPDLVIVDRALPLLDGFGVMRQLAGTIPAIVTSYDANDFSRAFELGASDFLAKPFTMRELIARARRLVRMHQRVVLRGSLADVGMPQLLTMLEQARKSGRLVVDHAGEQATIDLVEGRIVDAQWHELRVRDVLLAVLGWDTGTFELAASRGRSPDLGETPHLSVTHMLLEYARIVDEHHRHAS